MAISMPVSVLMAAAPLLLMGTVAVTARIDIGTYPHPGYGPTLHKDLLAYGQVMEHTDELFSRKDPSHVRTIETVLDMWLDGFESKKLRVVPPAEPTDIGDTGPRYEIARAKIAVSREANHQAEALITLGRYEEAGRILAKGFRVAQACRYMSPRMLSDAAQFQRCLITTSLKVAPHATASTRASLAEAVSQAVCDPREFKIAYVRFLRRTDPANPKGAAMHFDNLAITASLGKLKGIGFEKDPTEDPQGMTEWWAAWAIHEEDLLRDTVKTALPQFSGTLQATTSR